MMRRYEWGDPHDAVIADLPERLAVRMRAPERVNSAAGRVSSAPGPSDGRKWLEDALARAYAGNRNDTGLGLACQLRDDGLGFGHAQALMIEYAQRVPGSGYSEREALATLDQAYKRAPRPPASGGQTARPASSVPDEPYVNGTAPTDQLPLPPAKPPAPQTLVRRLPAPLDKAAYHGVLGKLARELEPYIEIDSGALLINLVLAAGVALGRGSHIQVGAKRHYPIVYAVDVGPTGDNKGDAWWPIDTLLEQVTATGEVDGLPLRPHIGGGLSTGEGLLYQLRDERREMRTDKRRSRSILA
jgi:hypothetical protein